MRPNHSSDPAIFMPQNGANFASILQKGQLEKVSKLTIIKDQRYLKPSFDAMIFMMSMSTPLTRPPSRIT